MSDISTVEARDGHGDLNPDSQWGNTPISGYIGLGRVVPIGKEMGERFPY